MSIGIGIRFPSGRYHATQWGRHVNEGVPEWPPSSWRLLRALVAVWKRKLDDDPSCDIAVMRPLLEKLSAPPHFALPPVGTGHTRHYMPTHDKKTKVFDVFVALDKQDEIAFFWPDVNISDAESRALSALLQNMNVFGRAESWCEARLLDAEAVIKLEQKVNCRPLKDHAQPDQEIVRVLCADPLTAFENEHTAKTKITSGSGKTKQQVVLPVYEPDWHLCMETLELHKQKWSDPPGSSWVPYVRESNCFAVEQKRELRSFKRPLITMARYMLDSTVLPLVQDTLPVAEQTRRQLMGIYRSREERRFREKGIDDFAQPRSEVFSGKNAEGVPLKDHAHVYILPADEDKDGRIDHITVIARMGFDRSELEAIDQLRELKRGQNAPKIDLVLVGLGGYDSTQGALLFEESREWISATPFIATRYQKARGQKRDKPELLGIENRHVFTQKVLREELERLSQLRDDIPDAREIIIEPVDRIGAHGLRTIQFKRSRIKRGADGAQRPAGGFRIVFPAPVNGPICLGHSAHFGLGMFTPVLGDSRD